MLRKIPWLLVLLIWTGCSSIPADAKKALEAKGVLDVLKQAASDKYDPPKDGRLKAGQVEMYIKVRRREVELSQAAAENLKAGGEKLEQAKEQKSLTAALEGLKAVGSLGNLATADIRAAQELGENTAEYMWVKGRVLEVGVAELVQKSQNQLKETLGGQVERMKAAREKATSEEQKQAYTQQIEALEKALQQSSESPTEDQQALEYNRTLIAGFDDALTSLETEMKKYAPLGSQQD